MQSRSGATGSLRRGASRSIYTIALLGLLAGLLLFTLLI
jgi:hypothetical protein